MSSLRLVGCFCLTLSAISSSVANDRFVPVYVIRDARIITEPGKTLPKATLVMKEGVIQDLGENPMIPDGSVIIDGKGLTVYPGFIDAGTNRGYDSILRRSSVGNEATEDLAADPLIATKPDNRRGLTPEFAVRSALNFTEDTIRPWRDVGFTVQCVLPDGGFFSGESCVITLSGRPPRESVLKNSFAQHATLRVIPGTPYPRALMGVFAHCRQTLLDAGHLQRRLDEFSKGKGVGPRPPSDPSLESLFPILRGKLPVVFNVDTADEILRALRFSEEFRLQPVLLGARQAWKVTDEIKKAKAKVILSLDFAEPNERENEFPDRVQKDNEQKRNEEIRNAIVLQEKGISFTFSTLGIEGERPERKFFEHLRKVISAGLSEEVALKALTSEPANLLGIESQVGQLAVGKSAHVVLTTGDLSKADTQIKTVFVDGIRFEYDPTRREAEGRSRPKGKEFAKKDRDTEPKATKEPDPKSPKEIDPKTSPKITKIEHPVELQSDRKPKLKTDGNVLIKQATLVPVSDKYPTLLPKYDILIEKGKITRIDANIHIPDYKGTIISAEGMFVMPGIIDTHAHFAVSGGVNESSLSVVPEVRVRDVINSEDIAIYRSLGGGVTTARLLHGSANVIGGQDAVIKLKYGKNANDLLLIDAPRGVKFALGENVKRTDGRFPNTRLGVEAVLVRAFTEAQLYRKQWDEYEKRKASGTPLPEPRTDLRLQALADILQNDLKVHCHCYRSDEILMLLQVAERFGVKIQSLQHVLEGYKVAPEIAAHGASCSLFSDWWAYKLEAYDAIPYAAVLLQQAGATVCMKSDSNELVRHLYQEAAKCMKYGGMSEADALKTITLNPAKQLGLDKRIGSIDIGKDADLAIFNGHPLNSYSRCEMTLVDGEVFFQRTEKLAPLKIAEALPNSNSSDFKAITKNPKNRYVLTRPIVHFSNGEARPVGYVVVDNGKIQTISNDRFPGAKIGEEVIDLNGLHLYPGMIDAATVLGLLEIESLRESKDYADGGEFQPDLRASVAVNPDSELIPVTRANGVLAVVTRPLGPTNVGRGGGPPTPMPMPTGTNPPPTGRTGPHVGGQGALINLSGWTPKEMIIADPVALSVEFPALRLFGGRTPNRPTIGQAVVKRQRQEKIRQLKELFEETRRYEAARKGNPELAITPRLESMLPFVRGEKPLLVEADRKQEILDAINMADDLKCKLILSGATESWKLTDQIKKRDIAVIVGPIMSLPDEEFDPYDAPYSCPLKLHLAGIRFAIRSEGMSNTRNLPYEAAMAVSYGLPPEEGLKAVTVYPAQILGVSNQIGSIEIGKRANLVIATGDLLQVTTQVKGLFIDGKPTDVTNKQTRLYEKYRERLKEVKEGRVPLGTK